MARTVARLNRLLPAGVVLGLAAAGGLVVLGPDDEPATADGYRITYDVVDASTGRRATEVVEVDRPYASRRVLPGGAGSATTPAGVFDRADGRWRQLAVVPPGEPGQDLQLAAPLAWGEPAGLARRDGTGSVAGLRCTWWLTREPLDTGVLAPPTTDDRARSCVDDAGRLLADTWRAGGRGVRTRTATTVEPIAELDPLDGTQAVPVDPRLVTTAVEELPAPAVDLVSFRALPRSSVVAAVRYVEVAPGSAEVQRRVQRTVLTRDGVVVVLDQVREAVARSPVGDRDVALGALGSGRVRGTGGGLVVEVAVGPGLLRVRSGLPLGELVGWLRTLSPA